MKIFTGAQLRELDKYTIEHEPVTSLDLMERAAKAIADVIASEWAEHTPVVVFAGPGNNGGDALAVARLLGGRGYKVDVYLFNVLHHLSEDCEANRQRLVDSDCTHTFVEVTQNFDPPKLCADTLVVDGLFGSGLNKPLGGGFASLVQYINQSPAQVVSIDLPSGLMAEDNTGNDFNRIVKATLTLTLQQRKLAMMFGDCNECIGRLRVLDIHLSDEAMEAMTTPYTTVEESEVAAQLIKRSPFAHKGSVGHALLMSGSYGMAGASILASRACLKTGAGKMTVAVPYCNVMPVQVAVPEAVLAVDSDEQCLSTAIDTTGYTAVGVGPGLGTEETTALALISQIRSTHCPMVLDADAINILSLHGAWLHQLPTGLILTPHPGEFDRLAGRSTCEYERLMKARDLAAQLGAYILLKGHYSALCLPDGQIIFNTTGNAGMATAGSGDVLTGMITALLAQGYSRKWACIIGMYLHGLAGDIAAAQTGEESLVASDIIDNISRAFRRIKN